MIEIGFDWLITKKNAVSQYNMYFLYYFELEKDTTHLALKSLIVTKIIHKNKEKKAGENHRLKMI